MGPIDLAKQGSGPDDLTFTVRIDHLCLPRHTYELLRRREQLRRGQSLFVQGLPAKPSDECVATATYEMYDSRERSMGLSTCELDLSPLFDPEDDDEPPPLAA